MSNDFNHLLLTKFNILTTAEYGPAARRLEKTWLERRLREFDTFCLPSVRSQTCKDFRWIVFCDAQSPEWFKVRMATYSDVLAPLYVSTMTNATMGQVLREAGYTDRRTLITTRIDNDDAISSDFIATVQDQFEDQDFQFINFPWGVRACEGALFTGYWRSNPFMSLIERPTVGGEPFKCVYFKQHHLVKKSESIRNIRRPVSWLRSMHASNTVQTQVGLPRLNDRSDRFVIEWANLPEAPGLGRKWAISAAGYRARLTRSKKFQRLARTAGLITKSESSGA